MQVDSATGNLQPLSFGRSRSSSIGLDRLVAELVVTSGVKEMSELNNRPRTRIVVEESNLIAKILGRLSNNPIRVIRFGDTGCLSIEGC